MDNSQEYDTDNIDKLIIDFGGCGRYQFVMTFIVAWVKVVSAMSMMVMAFGNYNPGWTCMGDNSTTFPDTYDFSNLTSSVTTEAALAAISVTPSTNNGTPTNVTGVNVDIINNNNNGEDKCLIYYACPKVQFTPGVTTIVTDWGLVCDQSWIPSLIISVQMVGVLVGSYLFGFLGDKFGRKTTMYASILFHVVVNIVAIFSTSWQMFAVVRFFIGVAIPMMISLPIILALEYVPFKWRNVLICFPLWTFGCLFFALFAWITEDWRYLHGVVAAASFVCLLPCYWIPESWRWLVVKRQIKRAIAVTTAVAEVNKANEQDINGRVQAIVRNTHQRNDSNEKPESVNHLLACLQLLRKNERLPTIVIGIILVTQSMIYYAISFGVKSLPGTFYFNLTIMYLCELPFTFVSTTLPNYIGRRLAIALFLGISNLCLFSIVGFELVVDEEDLRNTGILICIMIARSLIDAAWDVCITYQGELYPTIVRSTALAYGSWVARIGGIVAPYLIPNDPKNYFINYLIMAILQLVCFCLSFLVPEIKGKTMREVWDDELSVTQSLSDGSDNDTLMKEDENNTNMGYGDIMLMKTENPAL